MGEGTEVFNLEINVGPALFWTEQEEQQCLDMWQDFQKFSKSTLAMANKCASMLVCHGMVGHTPRMPELFLLLKAYRCDGEMKFPQNER